MVVGGFKAVKILIPVEKVVICKEISREPTEISRRSRLERRRDLIRSARRDFESDWAARKRNEKNKLSTGHHCQLAHQLGRGVQRIILDVCSFFRVRKTTGPLFDDSRAY